MAITAFLFGNSVVHAFNGAIDFDADTIKVALLANTYTPDQDLHDFFDDVSADEVTGTGYTAGGETLTTASVSYDGPSNTITLDGDDVSWANSTITARYAVVYKDTGTAGTSPLIGYVDFGEDLSSNNGTFQITWDASGIYNFTVD